MEQVANLKGALTGRYLEVKLFNKLPDMSFYIVEFFLKIYFRFLDDVKYKWKESIDVSPLWKLMNRLDPDIKFDFQNEQLITFLDNFSCSMV